MTFIIGKTQMEEALRALGFFITSTFSFSLDGRGHKVAWYRIHVHRPHVSQPLDMFEGETYRAALEKAYRKYAKEAK